MSDDSLLDAATEPGPPNVESTPEQFAARWNTRTRDERAQWLAHVRANSARGLDCWLMQHEQLADLARFHRERSERILLALGAADPELYERIMREQFDRAWKDEAR